MARPAGALLMLLKKGSKGPDEPEEGKDDEGGSAEYKQLAEAAFPNEDWDEDRIDALKELIRSCMEEG